MTPLQVREWNFQECRNGTLIIKISAPLYPPDKPHPRTAGHILYGVRSGEKYVPAIVAALSLDPRKVEKAIAA